MLGIYPARFMVLIWAHGMRYPASLTSYSTITAGYSWNHGCFLEVSSSNHPLTE